MILNSNLWVKGNLTVGGTLCNLISLYKIMLSETADFIACSVAQSPTAGASQTNPGISSVCMCANVHMYRTFTYFLGLF